MASLTTRPLMPKVTLPPTASQLLLLRFPLSLRFEISTSGTRIPHLPSSPRPRRAPASSRRGACGGGGGGRSWGREREVGDEREKRRRGRRRERREEAGARIPGFCFCVSRLLNVFEILGGFEWEGFGLASPPSALSAICCHVWFAWFRSPPGRAAGGRGCWLWTFKQFRFLGIDRSGGAGPWALGPSEWVVERARRRGSGPGRGAQV